MPLTSRIHIDIPLLSLLIILSMFGLLVLYSASGESGAMLTRQITRLSIAFAVLFITAQIPPHWMKIITLWLFVIGLIMLILVPLIGESHKGAQRWLNFGAILIQPSEIKRKKRQTTKQTKKMEKVDEKSAAPYEPIGRGTSGQIKSRP